MEVVLHPDLNPLDINSFIRTFEICTSAHLVSFAHLHIQNPYIYFTASTAFASVLSSVLIAW